MTVAYELSEAERNELDSWAQRQGLTDEKTRITGTEAGNRQWWMALGMLFMKANALIQPVLQLAEKKGYDAGTGLLLIIQTMIALHHENGGIAYTWAELNRRSPLQDAITLFDLQVVSFGIAAKIAGVSHSEFLSELGKAGRTPFQYSAEEALEDAARLAAVSRG